MLGVPSLLMIKAIERKTGANYLETIRKQTRLAENENRTNDNRHNRYDYKLMPLFLRNGGIF